MSLVRLAKIVCNTIAMLDCRRVGRVFWCFLGSSQGGRKLLVTLLDFSNRRKPSGDESNIKRI